MGPGPVTGPLERPSQETSETRKANRRKPHRSLVHRSRVAVRDLLRADMDLLLAAQRAERSRLLRSVSSRLRLEHLSRNAGVIAAFASLRAAIVLIADASERAAAMARLSAEETEQLAALATAQAAEMRAARRSILLTLMPLHREQRRGLRLRCRRQRLAFAVLMRRGRMPSSAVVLQEGRNERSASTHRRYHRRRVPHLRHA